jgi:TonB family protein
MRSSLRAARAEIPHNNSIANLQETRQHRGMSQQPQTTARTRRIAYGVCAAVALLLGANSAQAQWASKPAPALPRTILDQGISGSVVLGLVFNGDGSVRDARVVRGSGISGLDEVARDGAKQWRLSPASVKPSDLTTGRQHMIKFYQDSRVARRVEPYKAFWKEL